MVESKFVVFVLQMIPHTLFIEWDFWILFMALFTNYFYCAQHCSLAGYCSQQCSLAMTLFMTLFTSRCEVNVHIYGTVHVYGTVHIYDTIHTTSFFL